MLMRAATRAMMRSRTGYGRIVNISSISGIIGNPGQGNYSASKAGIIAMSKSLAREVASRGIDIVSSGDLVQRFEATWTPAQRATHMRASEALYRIKDRAFERARRALRSGSRREAVLATAWAVLFTVLLAVFAADTIAYVVGRLIGRHRLAPVISPGKTWEGLIAGMIAAVLVPFFAMYSSDFLDVGQSLAPSSTMILILRPRMPPAALICSIASCSAWMEPVSLIAMVPVAECRMPTVTSVSVTARPVALTVAVAGPAPNEGRGSIEMSGSAAAPISSLRRSGDCRPLFGSSDMSTPFLVRERLLVRRGLPRIVHCTDTQDRVYCTAK